MKPAHFCSLFTFLLMLSFVRTDAQTLGVNVILLVQPTCNTNNGVLQAIAYGGVPPYSYQWSNGATTAMASNLWPGTHTVTVTDANSQQINGSGTLQNTASIGNGYTSGSYTGAEQCLGVVGYACPGQCNGAMSMPDFMFNGTPPYSFSWSGGGGNISGICTTIEGWPVFGGFCVGDTVSYVVTDQQGCFDQVSFVVYGIDQSEVPVILNTSGACDGLSNGSVVVNVPPTDVLPPDLEVRVNGQLIAFLDAASPGVHTFDGLAPGSYTLESTWYDACPTVIPFDVPALGVNCGTVFGTVFQDLDQDCSQGVNEPGIPYQMLTIVPGPEYAITDGSGAFSLNVGNGSFGLDQESPAVAQICPVAQPVPFVINNNAVQVDLADTMVSSLDLEIIPASTRPRPGMTYVLAIRVRELSGSSPGPTTVRLIKDPIPNVVSASIGPDMQIGDTLEWNLTGIPPFGLWTVNVNLEIPASVPLGTFLSTSMSVHSTVPDLYPWNDTLTLVQEVMGPFDPNDKLVRTSTGWDASSYLIGTDEWLEYTIRFQNTGTDTAFNVVLTDTMDVDLDLSTFIPGAATHAFQVSMLPGRVVEWRAEGILLPDSLTDPGGSQGAISFRIQPHEPVLPGTEFRNNADIFFDVNPPIRTNDAVVVATMSTYIASKLEWNGLYVFPQPATDRLTVVSDRSLGEVVILNVDGRRLWPEKVTGDRVEVDISRLVQGHYLIRVTALDGAFAVRRFIRM